MSGMMCVGPEVLGGTTVSLRVRLRSLLAKAQETSKPWLGWPVTWESIRSSQDQQVLRAYLTSPDIHREKLEEVCLTASCICPLRIESFNYLALNCEGNTGEMVEAACLVAPGAR